MNYYDKKDAYDRDYRKVEAMYRKGYSNNYIIRSLPYLPDFEVLNMIQKVFALDQIKAERRNGGY